MEGEEGGGSVGGGGKIKIGVCVMEKKVKCGSEVLFFFFVCLLLLLLLPCLYFCVIFLLLTNSQIRMLSSIPL